MKKFKLFIENFLVYGFGGIISKIIPLVMIPIVAKIMPNSTYFGISDMVGTLVSFGSAIAILGMTDAMYRMFFEKSELDYKISVCSTTLHFTLLMSVLVFALMCLFQKNLSKLFFSSEDYSYLIYLSALSVLVGATGGVLSTPTRMQNKRKIFLVTNAISPIISYLISIPLLLTGYYIIALPMAGLISSLVLAIIFIFLNKKWFSIRHFDGKLLKELLFIAVPLFPSFLIYWLFNSCDRVMITNMIGLAASGIYAVGAKLGNCSQLIYTAFAGGWQYFAFSTMKEENQVKSNSQVFEYLGVISFAVTAFLCGFSSLIFKFLFEEEYYLGYIVAPYLFLAPLMQMLFQVASSQFVVIKKTWPNMFILFLGAIVNIIFNLLFIPKLGIEGAALATLFGYIVSDIICVIVLHKMKLMEISARFLIAILLMTIYMILWRMLFSDDTIIALICAIILTLIFISLYMGDLMGIKNSIQRRIKK